MSRVQNVVAQASQFATAVCEASRGGAEEVRRVALSGRSTSQKIGVVQAGLQLRALDAYLRFKQDT